MYLVHARPSLAEQRSGLDVLRHQFASHSRDLGPAVKDLQGQVLIGLDRLVWMAQTHTINNVTGTLRVLLYS